jgi:hypothetical protein
LEGRRPIIVECCLRELSAFRVVRVGEKEVGRAGGTDNRIDSGLSALRSALPRFRLNRALAKMAVSCDSDCVTRMERIEYVFRAVVAVTIVLIASGCGDARVASGSMEPTIRRGERVKINYGAYAMDGPQRWDVVAFEPPEAPKFVWISRVVAVPGERVSFDKGGIAVNG